MGHKRAIGFKQVHGLAESIFGEGLHAKRVQSVANATLGVIHATSLAVHAIGLGLAQARGLVDKHAIKQVDRLLSNGGVDVWELFESWVKYVVGPRKEIVVALDWTEFDPDGHGTIMLSMVTRHGRATPLIWLTIEKAKLKNRRNEYEDRVLARLSEVLREEVHVTLLADRGFGDIELYRSLDLLGFDYVIRFRGNIHVTDANGVTQTAAQWVRSGGRMRVLRNAQVTGEHFEVPTVVCVQAKKMKDKWCLASNKVNASGRDIIQLYSKRWFIEPTFRDIKDPRFGMGLHQQRVSRTDRRDRLFLISALSIALLTLLGAAGESIGMDRRLKANTVRRRTHSLFRQGLAYYGHIPTLADELLKRLMEAFHQQLQKHRAMTEIFGTI